MSNTPPLLRLVYVSRANKEMTLDDLTSILVVARATNPAHRVTGALLYQDKVFLQILEGPEAAVEALYEKIEGDPRHNHCRVLLRSPATTRLFPDWSMGHASATSAEIRSVPALNAFFLDPQNYCNLGSEDLDLILELFVLGALEEQI